MSWSEKELSTIDLGDKRLNRRGAEVLDALASNPNLSTPQQLSSWSELLAAYRFFDNEKVNFSKILSPHRESTIKRIGEHSEVLLLQDTSELDFSDKQDKIQGLGVLNSESRKGLYIHPLFAVTPQRLPLGVISVDFNFREKIHEVKGKNDRAPIEEKESYRWISQYLEAAKVAKELPETRVIVAGDRESDIYELFSEREKLEGNRPEYLVRLRHDRKSENLETKEILPIKQQLEKSKPLGRIKFSLPARKGECARDVEQEICSLRLTLQVPGRKSSLSPVDVTAVLARETTPPSGSEPLTWILLTSLDVTNLNDASEIVKRYLCRWDIELFFKVLKSGCKVEKLQFEHVDRLLPCLAIYMIVAWRVMFLTMLGRTCPELPCNLVFEDFEWKTIYTVTKKQPPPNKVPSINEMVKLVASWGGYLGRKNDPPPGHQAMWTGLQRCKDFVIAYEVLQNNKLPDFINS